MITIKLLNLEDPFNTYPQLTYIWPEPFNSTMQEAVLEDYQINIEHPELDVGNIYLAYKNNEVIGISGFFIADDTGYTSPYNVNTTTIYLRWHGIINSERGKGISEEIMNLVLMEAQNKYPKIQTLIELVPQTQYGIPLAKHFNTLGFIPTGEKENYSWSEYSWQPYHLDIPSFLLLHQQKNHKKMKK